MRGFCSRPSTLARPDLTDPVSLQQVSKPETGNAKEVDPPVRITPRDAPPLQHVALHLRSKHLIECCASADV